MQDTTVEAGPGALDNLVAGALRQLETLRYSALTIRNYGTTWRSYARFAAAGGATGGFSQEMADKFLACDPSRPTLGGLQGLVNALLEEWHGNERPPKACYAENCWQVSS